MYGERGGAWVSEVDEVRIPPPPPRTGEAYPKSGGNRDAVVRARFRAEQEWALMRCRYGLPVHIFRLAGRVGADEMHEVEVGWALMRCMRWR